jgi:hypothetical protein
MTKSTKNSCATVTPPGSGGQIVEQKMSVGCGRRVLGTKSHFTAVAMLRLPTQATHLRLSTIACEGIRVKYNTAMYLVRQTRI